MNHMTDQAIRDEPEKAENQVSVAPVCVIPSPVTADDLLRWIVEAWDGYRLGAVSRLMAVARKRYGLTLPDRNKDG